MIQLCNLPPAIDMDVLRAAQTLEPATLGHVLDSGFTSERIRWMSGMTTPVAGTVVTCHSVEKDSAIVHYAISRLRPGDFLVIHREATRREACFGGGLALAAQMAGCVGVIIDGPVTDIAELRALKLPVWATGLTALTTKRFYEHGTFCLPLDFDGLRVMPGDLAIGDENGVVILAESEFKSLLPRITKLAADQAARHARIRAGENFAELNGTAERFRNGAFRHAEQPEVESGGVSS